MSDMSWKDLRDLDCAAIRTVGEAWKSHVPAMIEQTERLRNDVVGGHLSAENFDSDTATQVREHIDLFVGRFEDDLSDYANIRVATTLFEVADELEAEQKDLEEVVREIEEHDFVIEGDKHDYDVNFSGDLHQALWLMSPPEWLCHRIGIEKPEGIDAIDRLRSALNGIDLTMEASEVAKEYQDWLRSIMKRAHDADDDAAAALAAMREHPTELPPELGATYDDLIDDYKTELSEEVAAEMQAIANGESDMSPEQVNQWWENLSETEQEALLTEHPEWVGPTDGIPVAVRDTANRTNLENQIASVDQKIDSIEAQLEAAGGDPNASLMYDGQPVDYGQLEAELAELQQERTELDDLADKITKEDGTPETFGNQEQPYYLLDFNPEDSGQLVVAIGNPDTATNVNVYVPGTTASFDGAGNDEMGHAESMAADAQRWGVAEEPTATVLWLGYDAPDNAYPSQAGIWTDAEAAHVDYATDAAEDLEAFSQGIRATAEEEPSNLTFSGHSYGTTVIGAAAASEGVEADNLLLIASPGVTVETADSLGVEDVYATRNEADVIQYTPFHGQPPVDDDFGATVIESDADGSDPFHNHGTYWGAANEQGRQDMTDVITGVRS